MSHFWRVAVYEYRSHVRRKNFIIALLSVPLLIIFTVGLVLFMKALNTNNAPLGYVDEAGVFPDSPIPAPVSGKIRAVVFTPYPDQAAARAALDAGEIQAFYHFPPDYFDSRLVMLVYYKDPGENATDQFYDFLQINLAAGRDPAIAHRIAAGSKVTVRYPTGAHRFPSDNPTIGVFMPIIIAVAFLMLLLVSSGYLMQAVVEEKENRTIEVLTTSVSPGQLIGGKIAGVAAVTLTQLVAWFGIGAAAVVFARARGVPWLQDIDIDWLTVAGITGIAVCDYVLCAALMVGIGSIAPTTREGQSIATIFTISHFLPTYMMPFMIESSSQTLAVVLSCLPFTALMGMSMRQMFSAVPTWQVIVSISVQAVCAVGAIWLASRAFRIGMLRYGQRVSLRELFHRVRVAHTPATQEGA